MGRRRHDSSACAGCAAAASPERMRFRFWAFSQMRLNAAFGWPLSWWGSLISPAPLGVRSPRAVPRCVVSFWPWLFSSAWLWPVCVCFSFTGKVDTTRAGLSAALSFVRFWLVPRKRGRSSSLRGRGNAVPPERGPRRARGRGVERGEAPSRREATFSTRAKRRAARGRPTRAHGALALAASSLGQRQRWRARRAGRPRAAMSDAALHVREEPSAAGIHRMDARFKRGFVQVPEAQLARRCTTNAV